MNTSYRKVKKYLELIDSQRLSNIRDVEGITSCPVGYKESNTPPALSDFTPFRSGDTWGSGDDTHAWFHFTLDVPECMRKAPVRLLVKTDKTGWDAGNPQFIAYIDGVMRQGLDTNHTFVCLDGTHHDVCLYGYTGAMIPCARLFVQLANVNVDCDQLFYDIRFPFQMLDYLHTASREYAEILKYLDMTVSMLDLLEIGSPEFFESVKAARAFIEDEFYGKYCSTERGSDAPTTIGIGHTHIDCAWLWTLKQTREKVQRSFSTVLELMDRYPEYKFMSSQALLYKDLKEEAPEVYERVKERIKDGRWECEGAMWVEADCNLTSGESLVRQVMYGKRFFKEEFGVENRVLWLPDVFGYSAALPQILKKSGVDWFVTSKISWNDTNMMPYDTFAWKGIDGTEINSYFLTAQDQNRSGNPTNGTTYVANTNAQMISGTYNRYQQKDLNNEAIVTFGFGDGGGGPTAEMLELGRRSAKGVPGAPLFKIDFAGDFLKRLEKKIENNPRLPEWQGELYLEFHRGTYTSIAKNKKNNRQSEFLYQDAEALAVAEKALLGTEFPKAELHRGWEMILTNQFHDIIPGSSIKPVYDQCDIDYAEIKSIGQKVAGGAKTAIASKLDKNKGYVVFNPHSFEGSFPVKVDGKTAIVDDVPSKGYTLTDTFFTDNHVEVSGHTVETDSFTVKFDESWQIVSLFDKLNNREIVKPGTVANEIRLYADQPDIYDNWEWQAYSTEKYIALTALESVEEVNDGARHGIKLVRPYKQSKITQTIWFWDCFDKIDFETTADWHQHHVMVKAAFPTTINSDKATYEIQFGTIERPTHFNTSWDKAKFEVCAQKYADLSDGGFGVSIINDCKYGHDIHNGTITLSLLKCGTYPNPEADQGEMSFTYSICPHSGRLTDSRTAKYAYYLNYPLTAVKATGETSELPERWSAVTLSGDHVICETIKESEDGNDTILRLYEYKNQCGRVFVSTDLKFEKAYLCDLQENELKELEVDAGGDIVLDVTGFEIVTIKLK